MYYRLYLIFLIFIHSFSQGCGIALVRLLKPLSYYTHTYNNPAWGLHKTYLLMEKQRNRGQDGAGLGVIKFNMPPGTEFMHRTRAKGQNAIEQIFEQIAKDLPEINGLAIDEIKEQSQFIGELYLGHLRYGTQSDQQIKCCQPHIYRNIVACKQLALIGNFNLTNTQALFNDLHLRGLNPISTIDTHLILQSIAHEIDKEYERLLLTKKYLVPENHSLSCHEIAHKLSLTKIISRASEFWDGGYVFAGAVGTGDTFLCRDPSGIRPCFYLYTDEVFAAASERAALINVFNADVADIKELPPAHVIVIKKNGDIQIKQFCTPLTEQQCSFERIYFSRVNDPDIYQERKQLGKELAHRILEKINYDLIDTIFSYVPNSGEPALIGCIEEINKQMKAIQINAFKEKIDTHNFEYPDLEPLYNTARYERLMFKDLMLRTFITNDANRTDLVSHIYDVTKGAVTDKSTLVIFDDSIVRGTTLQTSILKQLMRLNPKRIIIVSSAPLLLYPDCYGIDISQMEKYIAFKAIITLLKEQNKQALIDQIYTQCKAQEHADPRIMKNHVKKLYNQFTQEEIEQKIAELVIPGEINWNGELTIMYQTLNGLHKAIPHYTGDWYFSGDYPTFGGYKVLNTSFINWYEGNNTRAY